MHIVLDDVLLRRPEPKDVELLYKYRNNREVIDLLGGFSKGYSVRDLQEWVESHRTRTDEIIWVIAELQNDSCLGHVGLYQIDHRVRSAEFAIVIGDKSWWGKGLGNRVSSAVIDYGFRQLNLHRIQLSVLATNPRAIQLYEKLGFKPEGRFRHAQFRDRQYVDLLAMSLLEDEW